MAGQDTTDFFNNPLKVGDEVAFVSLVKHGSFVTAVVERILENGEVVLKYQKEEFSNEIEEKKILDKKVIKNNK